MKIGKNKFAGKSTRIAQSGSGGRVKITQKTPGNTPTRKLSGTVLTIEGVAIDVAARQRDVHTVLSVSMAQDRTITEGIGLRAVATIYIPARKYVLVPGPDDENGNPTEVPQAVPLDVDAVPVELYGLP